MSENNFTDLPLISSIHNPTVRRIASLYKSKERTSTGLTIIEGTKILQVALAAGVIPEEILFDTTELTAESQSLLHTAQQSGSTLMPTSPEALSRVSKREGPLELVATVKIPKLELPSLSLKSPALVLIAEGIEKPGNLGVLIRTAAAAAADAFIAVDAQANAFDPSSVTASLGAVFTTPVVDTSLEECLKWLKLQSLPAFATSPQANKEIYYQKNLTGSLAFVIGNEHLGVSPDWFDFGTPIQIPISPQMDSLNGTTAAGIVLFEALRQRNT